MCEFSVLFMDNSISSGGTEWKWKNIYTGNEIDTSMGVIAGKLKDDRNQNCGLFIPLWNGWTNWLCQIPASQLVNCACEHPQQMNLQLRGLCPASNIDRFYAPRNKKKSGAVLLLGLDTSIIEYENGNEKWKLTEYSHNTTAITDAPLASYVLGSHNWLIENDDIGCNNGESYTTVLKLTGCREGEFTCSDGQCIRYDKQKKNFLSCFT